MQSYIEKVTMAPFTLTINFLANKFLNEYDMVDGNQNLMETIQFNLSRTEGDNIQAIYDKIQQFCRMAVIMKFIISFKRCKPMVSILINETPDSTDNRLDVDGHKLRFVRNTLNEKFLAIEKFVNDRTLAQMRSLNSYEPSLQKITIIHELMMLTGYGKKVEYDGIRHILDVGIPLIDKGVIVPNEPMYDFSIRELLTNGEQTQMLILFPGGLPKDKEIYTNAMGAIINNMLGQYGFVSDDSYDDSRQKLERGEHSSTKCNII